MNSPRNAALCDAPVAITFVGFRPPSGQVGFLPQDATACVAWANMSKENASPG